MNEPNIKIIRRTIIWKALWLEIRGNLAIGRSVKIVSGLLLVALISLIFFVLLAPHFGFTFLTIMGDSMAPVLPAGSVTLVQPVESSDIQIGDIIAYKSGSETSPLVTHRVIALIYGEESLSFQTSGDANEKPDRNLVSASKVIGKVVFHIPFIGFIMHFVKRPLGYGLLIGLPALTIIIIEIESIIRRKSPLKKRKQQEVT